MMLLHSANWRTVKLSNGSLTFASGVTRIGYAVFSAQYHPRPLAERQLPSLIQRHLMDVSPFMVFCTYNHFSDAWTALC